MNHWMNEYMNRLIQEAHQLNANMSILMYGSSMYKKRKT